MSSRAGDAIPPGRSAPPDYRSTGAPRPGVWLTDLSLLLMAMIWGVNFSVVKYATGHMDPLSFNFVRVTIAAAALMLIAAFAGTPWPTRRVALALVALGMLGNGIYQVFFVEGIARTRAGDAALVVAATPAFIALLGRLRGTERVALRGWLGILLSMTGIGFVTFGTAHGAAGRATLIGDLLILGGALCWAVYTVLLKPYTHALDGVKLSAFTMIGGILPLAIAASPTIGRVPWGEIGPKVWMAMAYSGILGLVVAYYFWYRGIRIIGPTRTAMYSNLQPIFAVAVAWAALGESPTLWQGIGAASIMTGLLLARS